MSAYLPCTIVGTGYYGTRLAGNLFSDERIPGAKLVAFVDTHPNPESFAHYKIAKKPGIELVGEGIPDPASSKIPLFQSLPAWKQWAGPDLNRMLVDLALRAQHAPGAFFDYVNAGVRRFVLPKPFTFDPAVLAKALQEIQRHQVKTAVASNWFYSDITAAVRELLANSKYAVVSAVLDYSKKIATPRNTPTHDELPHAIQILASTGLIDPVEDAPTVTRAEKLKVSAQYKPVRVQQQVTVNSFTDTLSSSPTGRERVLKVFLDDGDPQPDIVADYDIKFDTDGNYVSGGKVTVDTPEVKLEQSFPEDTMALMYRKIVQAMPQPFEQYQRDPSVLTLEKYQPVTAQVAEIHRQWEALLPESERPKGAH